MACPEGQVRNAAGDCVDKTDRPENNLPLFKDQKIYPNQDIVSAVKDGRVNVQTEQGPNEGQIHSLEINTTGMSITRDNWVDDTDDNIVVKDGKIVKK